MTKLDFKYTFNSKSNFLKAEHLINSSLVSLVVSFSKRQRKLLGKLVQLVHLHIGDIKRKQNKEKPQSIEKNQCNFPGNYWQNQIWNRQNRGRKATHLNIMVILTVRIISAVLQSKMDCDIWKMLMLTKILKYVRVSR